MKKGIIALSPLAVFVILYFVTSIIARDFYKVPITVAFMAASMYAVLISGNIPLRERIDIYSRGAAKGQMMLMIWIFILAGAFAHTAKVMGAIDATVNLALTLLPGNMLLAGLFLAACFVSVSVGTSVGTIVALTPIAAGVAQQTGTSIPLMTAVVVGGSFFGDNLSFISDTTIAATSTQGCKLSDKFRDITTGGENNARMHATLPGGGTLVANWNGNIDHWKQHQSLFLAIKGLDMTQLSPWTVYYTGQPIEDGVFGLTTRLNINNSNLDNQNKIDIYKATVGSRRPDVEPQQKIPLKTALYILKDKDDKILIDLPVKGNIDSPEFNYMKLVWKTLGQLLVKVATSPARALAGALGLKSDNLEFMEIEPSQRSLTSEQYHVLADLATIAKSDSLVVINLQRQMPEEQANRAERLEKTMREYLSEQGTSERQITITTGNGPAEDGRTGYAIISEMKID